MLVPLMNRMDLVVVFPNQFDVARILDRLRCVEPLCKFIQQFLLVSFRHRLIGHDLRNLFFHSSLRICVLFALRIDSGKHHQNVCSDLIVLGEVLEAVLLGYSFGLGLEPLVSLIKFSDHCHLLLRCDETLNLPFREPGLFHPRHTPRPLRACRERPRGRRAADERDELAPLHSITSSAWASNVGGTSRPSAFAVTRLMTRSNLVGCSIGISAGFVPRRILSICSAARR